MQLPFHLTPEARAAYLRGNGLGYTGAVRGEDDVCYLSVVSQQTLVITNLHAHHPLPGFAQGSSMPIFFDSVSP